jgi:hypothetical protein
VQEVITMAKRRPVFKGWMLAVVEQKLLAVEHPHHSLLVPG